MDSDVRRGRFRRRLFQAIGGIALIIFYRNVEDFAERYDAHTFLYSLLDDVAPTLIQKAWALVLDGISHAVDLLTSDYAIGAFGMLLLLAITDYRREIFNYVLSNKEPADPFAKARWHIGKLQSLAAFETREIFDRHVQALRECASQFEDGSSIQDALNIICDTEERWMKPDDGGVAVRFHEMFTFNFLVSRALRKPETAEKKVAGCLSKAFEEFPSPEFFHSVASAKINQERYLKYLENYRQTAGKQLRISRD